MKKIAIAIYFTNSYVSRDIITSSSVGTTKHSIFESSEDTLTNLPRELFARRPFLRAS